MEEQRAAAWQGHVAAPTLSMRSLPFPSHLAVRLGQCDSLANRTWVQVLRATSGTGTEALGRCSGSLLLCFGELGAMCQVKSLLFQGLFVIAAKPSLVSLDAGAPGVWAGEAEGDGKESVKAPSCILILASQYRDEMKGRHQVALTPMSEMTLLGSHSESWGVEGCQGAWALFF